ncbi:unnamed protein product [Rhizophagus irregularis]|nr:unnamed protein product [Rhizophagus irregularis]
MLRDIMKAVDLSLENQLFGAILAPKNVDVYLVNTIIMDQFPGEAVEYLSADTIKEQSNSEYQYSIEFLNSITIGGLPPHKLVLKK